MARTIAQIYDALNKVKANMQELHDFVVDNKPGYTLDNAETLLSDLSSKNKVAIWRLWLWLMAVASWMVESLFDIHKEEVVNIISRKRPHTLRWYSEESKKFQYGYELEWLGDTFGYNSNQPEARIITYASASEVGDKLIIKVATEKKPNIKPLSAIQLFAFKEYWAKMKDAGVKLEIISLPADEVKVTMKIIRSRMVLDSQNRLLRDTSIKPIDNAVAIFGANLEFDGILRLSDFADAIKSAEGVIDVKIIEAYHRPAGGVWQKIDMSVTPVSGYFIIDWNNSNITYEDEINVPTVQ